MFKYLNLHPQKKDVKDCVKRALAFVSGLPYEQVARELNALKKETGCRYFNDDKNWKRYADSKGWTKMSFPAVAGEPWMNGERFCKSFSKGTYLLRMAGHLTAVKDGVLYDTWDCSAKCVYNAWKVLDGWKDPDTFLKHSKTSTPKSSAKAFTPKEREILAAISKAVKGWAEVRYYSGDTRAEINDNGCWFIIDRFKGRYRVVEKFPGDAAKTFYCDDLNELLSELNFSDEE